MERITFGTKLKKLREDQDLTVRKLAEKLEIHFGYLSNLELGRRNPSEELIKKIANFFNYPEEELKMLAGYIPKSIEKILKRYPIDAPKFLRKKFKT